MSKYIFLNANKHMNRVLNLAVSIFLGISYSAVSSGEVMIIKDSVISTLEAKVMLGVGVGVSVKMLGEYLFNSKYDELFNGGFSSGEVVVMPLENGCPTVLSQSGDKGEGDGKERDKKSDLQFTPICFYFPDRIKNNAALYRILNFFLKR